MGVRIGQRRSGRQYVGAGQRGTVDLACDRECARIDVAQRESLVQLGQLGQLEKRARTQIEHFTADRSGKRARQLAHDRLMIQPPRKAQLEAVIREVIDGFAHHGSGRRATTKNSAVGEGSARSMMLRISSYTGRANNLRALGKLVQRVVRRLFNSPAKEGSKKASKATVVAVDNTGSISTISKPDCSTTRRQPCSSYK